MDRGCKGDGTVLSCAEKLKVILLGSKRLPVERSDRVLKIRIKTQSVRIYIKLALVRRSHHPDSNGMNDTQIRARMKKLEQVKVQV